MRGSKHSARVFVEQTAKRALPAAAAAAGWAVCSRSANFRALSSHFPSVCHPPHSLLAATGRISFLPSVRSLHQHLQSVMQSCTACSETDRAQVCKSLTSVSDNHDSPFQDLRHSIWFSAIFLLPYSDNCSLYCSVHNNPERN